METAAEPRDQVPFGKKIAFAVGIVPNWVMANSIGLLAIPIFSIALGVDPALMGIAFMISKIWDAFTDPLVGNWSDNTRSRFGRRRPWIAGGVIAAFFFYSGLWWAPHGLGETELFAWFVVFTILINTAYTVYLVPYNALAYEISYDYDERTRIMTYRAWFAALTGVIMSWVYKVCFLGEDEGMQEWTRWLLGDGLGNFVIGLFGQNEADGMRVMGIVLAAIMVAAGLMPVLFLREHREVMAQRKVNLIEAFKMTIQDKPFLLISGAIFLVLAGILVVGPLSQYVVIYYVAQGDKAFGATLIGWLQLAWTGTTLLFVPAVGWIGTKFGKKNTLLGALLLTVVGNVLNLLLYTPEYPYLAVFNQALLAPGVAALWIMDAALIADVTDHDELKNGLRREGMFGAVHSWVFKGGSAVALGASGILINWTGVDSELDGLQPVDTQMSMLLLIAFVPAIFAALAMVLVYLYPITKEQALETRRLLDERKQREKAEAEHPAASASCAKPKAT